MDKMTRPCTDLKDFPLSLAAIDFRPTSLDTHCRIKESLLSSRVYLRKERKTSIETLQKKLCQMKKLIFPVLITLALLSLTQGNIFNVIHKKGYCIWYDQCLKMQDKALNCLYNGPARRLNDTKGIVLLRKLCPKFSMNRLTCCSTKQLETLDKKLNNLPQYPIGCPSCWQNMLDLFCELSCSPDQSMFVNLTSIIGFPPFESILRVDYYVSNDFKQGFYDSCKDVTLPGRDEPLIYLLCGERLTCTPQKLVENMGSSAFGLFYDFDVRFPEIIPANNTWMSDGTYRCNQSFVNPWTRKAFDKCTCRDCIASCGHRHRNVTRRDPYDSPSYRKVILNITANSMYPQNHTGYYRYPDDRFIPFGHIFHLDLLNQALDLQLALTNMKVPYTSENTTMNITLDSVCYKPPAGKDKCVIESVFQYFQNNKTRLNLCLSSLGSKCTLGMTDFVKAEYHDHFLFCSRFPFAKHDNKWGGGSCLGENGLQTMPEFVLHGFNNSEFNMADYLIISFVFKNHTDERENQKTEAWEKAFLSYMKEYVRNPNYSNLTVIFSAQMPMSHEKTTAATTTTTSTTTSKTTTTKENDGHLGVDVAFGRYLAIFLAVLVLSLANIA